LWNAGTLVSAGPRRRDRRAPRQSPTGIRAAHRITVPPPDGPRRPIAALQRRKGRAVRQGRSRPYSLETEARR
jgi:hypothetical protein